MGFYVFTSINCLTININLLHIIALPVHFRHPNEVGGTYWSFGFFLALASLPMAVYYYEIEVENEEVVKLWNACYALLPCSLFIMSVFLANIKSEYRKTFWSTGKAKDMTLSYFERSEDGIKALVFIFNRRHWKSIENDVEEWVRESWERWMAEEPEWLDKNTKASIPPHMIPNIKDREEVNELRHKRRRSSFGRRRSSLKGGANTVKVTPDEKCDASYLTSK